MARISRTFSMLASSKKEAPEMTKRKIFEFGGYAAAAVLVAFGIAALVMGVNGRDTVNSSLKQEQIVGSSDMTPKAIAGEVAAAKAAQVKLFETLNQAGEKLTPSPIDTPSCSVAGKQVKSGDAARCFAKYMRIHTFEATSGLTYSQMGRFVAKPGTPVQFTDGLGGTSDTTKAVIDPKTKQPVSNGRRDIWVTYTALTTALNTSYMASQLSLFAIVVGVALLLAGIGFGILAFATFRLPALVSPAKDVAEAPTGKLQTT
jgi:F0F1-type ATP synthase membrane subunit c/vacuolar-type H+-ATPase subunit K